METYNTQTSVTPEYQSRFTLWTPVNDMLNRSKDRPMAEKMLYWGKDMWLWQHWIRKGLFYPLVILAVYILAVIIIILIVF